jgi:hypothetical protein
VANATGVIAAAWSLGLDVRAAADALSRFTGVRRRFELVADVGGVTVVDDYAHHPTEVQATLAAAHTAGFRRVWVVFQPHRYTRTQAFGREFGASFEDADHVVLMEVYSAGEAPIPGVSGKTVLDALLEHQPHANTAFFPHRVDVAGYVAGFPIPEVLQGLNAFTLGMRSVNPAARIKHVWLDAWFDPPRERDAAMTLMNQGAEVLAFHTGSSAVMAAAQERGRLAIAYHSDMRSVAPDAQLAAVEHEWGGYYTERVRAVLDARWTSGNFWGGVRAGMVRVGAFGPKMPRAVQAELLAAQQAIAGGRLRPFAAGRQAVRDHQGRVVIRAGQALGDAQILQMNWLVEGVQGTLPR